MISAKVLKDSQSCWSRLTTFELTYPRCIHSELMTHRVFSRNSASSRAIPVKVMLEQVREHPFVPFEWGGNNAGMASKRTVDAMLWPSCEAAWLRARDSALDHAERLLELGLHKQIINRVLEPFSWITVIVSSTTYSNWFKLRDNEHAEPHIQVLARVMRIAYNSSEPVELQPGEWHTPFTNSKSEIGILISAARCARGSYLQQHGSFTEQEDIELATRLRNNGHWSPFEHQAMALDATEALINVQHGNFFKDWRQHRKCYTGEDGCM